MRRNAIYPTTNFNEHSVSHAQRSKTNDATTTFLGSNELQARRSSGGAIEPAIRLGVTLRMLAGGMHHDQMISWCIGRSTVYNIFKDTIHSINCVIAMPGVPLGDESKLKKLADEFNASRSIANPLYGCVAALDGIAITICKPPDHYVPRNFFCRKGMYALPVQAVVDARYRFLYMSCSMQWKHARLRRF